ncbi:UpxY family transcription antiterminator [Flavobacterium sp. GSP27]|uniref:UpxY family transcription antiterminator n=1 Tax=Flavobacterium sp. GSP27 TaxID=2497489 RepID=UPI000F83A7B7|nr:UpxY family transcription antiterminator [Flavobacterium sp. GSP27]RTZ10587.1 UpxY family transcription antiterminator [Flavobacterium sp. GSP27]
MNWYVVYTKPKGEKKVAEQLNRFGINCYCPLIIKEQQWSDRKKKIQVPLFNHYVFVQLAEKDRNLVFASPGVIRYLFWLGKHAIVKDTEIKTIKEWLKDETAEISITSYQVGETIQVDSGPFLNQNAVVKEITNTHYFLILESLGCTLKIRIK